LSTSSSSFNSDYLRQPVSQDLAAQQTQSPGKVWQWTKSTGGKLKSSSIKPSEPPKAPTDLSEHIMRLLIQYPVLGKGMSESQRQFALRTAEKRSAKALELMRDLLSQCDSLELSESNPNSYFAVFQDQLASSPLADLYAILRQRILGSDLDFSGAKTDLEGVLQKLERSDLKAEMTDIAQKMAKNEASPEDIARYRELGEKLVKG
jgi:DNA primase